jgi:hypothetical protein
MMSVLEGLRDSLATIQGVASCKIGLEKNISPADYPLIRVVPSRINQEGMDTRKVDCMIYFGMAISEAETGLEAVYSALFEMETAINSKLPGVGAMYRETIADEDRLDTYKVMAIRCEVVG